MNKELLKQVLIEQREVLLNKEFGTERDMLSDIEKKIGLPFVHIITGIRRCGKSTFLRQIIKRYFNDSNFYYINFEDERLFNFKVQDFNIIYETLVELFGEKNTFFIDEIQNVDYFETFVRRFSDAGYKFVLTGSNAKLLSIEIATKLTGRHVDTELQPFSFTEFLKYQKYNFHSENIYKTKERALIKKYFYEYLYNGGMPEFLKFRDPEFLYRTYEDIIIKDIAVRNKISNYIQLKELSQYLITNFTNRFSYNSLKDTMDFGSVNTVKSYIHYLENSFLISIVNKFDHSLKKQIANSKKVFVSDNGFINNISSRLTKDYGRLLENTIYNFLSTQGVVNYYSGKNECDFVLLKNGRVKNVFQITFELNEGNKKREINGLLEAMRFFNIGTGFLLTYDTEDEIKTDVGKIILIPVWKYLLQQQL